MDFLNDKRPNDEDQYLGRVNMKAKKMKAESKGLDHLICKIGGNDGLVIVLISFYVRDADNILASAADTVDHKYVAVLRFNSFHLNPCNSLSSVLFSIGMT